MLCAVLLLWQVCYVKLAGLTPFVLNRVRFGCTLISAQIKLVNRRKCLRQHVAQQLKLLAAEQAQLRSSLSGSQGARAAVCLSLPISLLLCSLWGLLLLV